MPNSPGGINVRSIPLFYRNPVRDARVSFGRIDQGVDYSGSGPIHALGSGTIVDVYNSGWPGGTFIDEHLITGGYWYTAENVTPNVHIGEHVTSSTVIGELTGGTEMGWAAPPPDTGESLAHFHGNYAFPTPEGTEANTLLTRLGAPGPHTKGPVGPNQQPIQAHTTSLIGDIFGGILGGTSWKDTLERFGLIVMGGALILIGVWMLAGKAATKVAVSVAAPEAKAGQAAASKARSASEGNS